MFALEILSKERLNDLQYTFMWYSFMWYSVQGGSNFSVCGWNPVVWPFKWKVVNVRALSSFLFGSYLPRERILLKYNGLEIIQIVHLPWHILLAKGVEKRFNKSVVPVACRKCCSSGLEAISLSWPKENWSPIPATNIVVLDDFKWTEGIAISSSDMCVAMRTTTLEASLWVSLPLKRCMTSSRVWPRNTRDLFGKLVIVKMSNLSFVL